MINFGISDIKEIQFFYRILANLISEQFNLIKRQFRCDPYTNSIITLSFVSNSLYLKRKMRVNRRKSIKKWRRGQHIWFRKEQIIKIEPAFSKIKSSTDRSEVEIMTYLQRFTIIQG